MKIAVWHNLPSGGGKRALYDHVRGLLAKGHRVEAWCPPTADRVYLPLRNIVTEHVVDLDPKYFWSPEASTPGKSNPLRWAVWSRLRAMERHSKECADQINSRGFDLLLAACCMFYHTPVIGRFVDLPSVLYLQEPNRSFYESLPILPWLAPFWKAKQLLQFPFWRETFAHETRLIGCRVLAREERRNAMAFDEILVNSCFSRESVLRAFGVDSRVCYLGIDSTKFVNQKKKRESFAVFVGALLPPKNVEFLVQSLGKVAAPLRPKLILIANMVDPLYLERLTHLARNAEVVLQLKHRIEDAELLDTLNRARIMLYAPRLEPFGYAPLEANACGLPVIAVAEGGVRETIQDGVNGLVVDSDPAMMAAAVERIMLDDELHARLSAQAEVVAKSTWALGPAIDRLEQRLRVHGGNFDSEHRASEGRNDSVLSQQGEGAPV
jgi:glycosyltransferase involved in cell wall biosynthesis